ncbi:MAG: cobalamin-binding protein [Deltaproteobacteria bacterium]|nr:cobalamin-binding protein [Deltaproteobacteria bacterium]
MKPKRIVSLCPSNTEILFALGVGESVVGVDSYSDYPPEVKNLPRVGPDLRVSIEKIKSLEPDLVVASLTVPGMERNIEGLKEANLSFIILNPTSIEETLSDILTLGKITGTVDKAERLVEEVKYTMNSIKSKTEKAQNIPKLYWEWWPKPLIAACRHSWVTDMSEIVGGFNVFSYIEKTSSIVEDSDILKQDPDILLICWCGEKMQENMREDKIIGRPGWEKINGIKENKVHCVPEPLFGRPGPRIIDGLKTLSQIVHPEIFGRL